MFIDFDQNLNIIKLDGVKVSLHCHHYNCGLIKALEEMGGLNAREIFIEAAAEEFYINFKKYILDHLQNKTAREKLTAAADLYRLMGFGRIDLSGLGESGGIAYSDSSYYVVGWLAKYGRRETPVCHLAAGFLSGVLSAVYEGTIGKYNAEEKKCMVIGHDLCEFVVSVRK
jgi:V4R domain